MMHCSRNMGKPTVTEGSANGRHADTILFREAPANWRERHRLGTFHPRAFAVHAPFRPNLGPSP